MKTLRNLIGGSWTDSHGDAFHDVVDPATEEVVGRCPAAHPQMSAWPWTRRSGHSRPGRRCRSPNA